jgi:hypothetical protein
MTLRELLESPAQLSYNKKQGQQQPAQKALRIIKGQMLEYIPTGYRVRVSGSAVNIPEIPWISILNPELTTTTKAGLYIVYLYSADLKSLYLSMNQGYTRHKDVATASGFKGKNAIERALKSLKSETKDLARELKNNEPINLKTINSIDLKSIGELPQGYESGHITGFKYSLNNMPDENQLITDLDIMFTIYDTVKEINDGLRNSTKVDRITLSRDVKIKNNLTLIKSDDHGIFEPRTRDEYVASFTKSSYTVSPLHEALINDFAEYVKKKNWRPLNKKIQNRDMILQDDSGYEILIEAKSVGKSQEIVVRQAIGQLFAYRYVYYQGKDIPLIALFNREINEIWQGLLASLNIYCIYSKNNKWHGTGLRLIDRLK